MGEEFRGGTSSIQHCEEQPRDVPRRSGKLDLEAPEPKAVRRKGAAKFAHNNKRSKSGDRLRMADTRAVGSDVGPESGRDCHARTFLQ